MTIQEIAKELRDAAKKHEDEARALKQAAYALDPKGRRPNDHS